MESCSNEDLSVSDENIMKILVATDNHLGYAEKDPIRKNDSFETFEEILQIAQKQKVDMILLGGDLFHENKPTRKTVHKVISLLRKYCLGDKECNLEFVSDPATNFGHCDFSNVNYQDPNYNIAYPLFSVHGNHDDPTGEGFLSAIDIISTAGLLNHFGKSMSCDKIEMSPVLLKKGNTKLALYGLGAMRDERLHSTFSMKRVNMLRPRENPESWFNIFVIHQNRAKHGPKNYIPESFLDDFLDLVIWGHEHECLIDPVCSESSKRFYVSQPGSSVATSLSEGEAKPKHVAVLHIHEKKFKMEKIPLNTVRQFMIDHVVLKETELQEHEDEKVYSYLTEKVERLIDEAERLHTGHPKQPMLPLIRIKVEYSGGYDIINPHRFGQQFVDRVANCKDILLFYRKKVYNTNKDKKDCAGGPELRQSQADSVRIEDLINEYLSAMDESLQLNILSERKLSKALNEFVLKDENDAIIELVKFQLKKTQEELMKRNIEQDNIDQLIGKFKEAEDNMDEKEEDEEIEQVLASRRSRIVANEVSMIDDDMVDEELPTKSNRGSRGGRGRRGGKSSKSSNQSRISRGGGRGRSKSQLDVTQTTISGTFLSTTRNKAGLDNDDDNPRSGLSSSKVNRSYQIPDNFSDEDSDPFSSKSFRHGRR